MRVARMTMILLFTLVSVAIAQTKTTKAPDFKLKDQNGKEISLSSLKGKAVVINFWATWCPPCREEIPGFIKVYNRLKDKGVELVGISLDREGWEVVRPFLKKYEINYPVVVGDRELTEAYGGIRGIPTTFFVDRNGNIEDKHVGYMSEADFEKQVKKLL